MCFNEFDTQQPMLVVNDYKNTEVEDSQIYGASGVVKAGNLHWKLFWLIF